ncbi:MAG: cobalamin-dependent protein [Candidatus Methanoperedens sp.]
MTTEQIRDFLIDAILQGEREQANKLLDDQVANSSYRKTMEEILEPVLEEIGNMWNKEKISLAQGYIAGKVAEDFLIKIRDSEAYDKLKEKRPVIMGNIEDDFHSLGRKLVCTFLEVAGWQVFDLGNDVTAKDFVDKAVETGARVIGVSAMMFTTAENIKKVRQEIDKRKLTGKIKLAVGGAVFRIRPELVGEIGGDGTASNAPEAPKLFEELWNKSLKEVPA